MSPTTRIRDLFVSDVTRDIPPVVYFHEQTPAKLAAEVSEYIVTGGWPEGHPNHRRVEHGIHEEYVKLLRNMARELERPGGPDLPTVWISGFYGSGKSSFAKLLGLALDGAMLPDGTPLADAWLKRDVSPLASELHEAWHALRAKVDPVAVVFDIGAVARDGEQIHAAAVRQVQQRLGYCPDPLVADHELRLERDGKWELFEQTALDVLGVPWKDVKTRALVEDDFSWVLSVMSPEIYTDPTSWFMSRGGTSVRADSPEEAVTAIRDMLRFRRNDATLFLVIDEVSQYVLPSRDRVDRLRAFATALGTTLRGKAWLLALGQQKLEDDSKDEGFLVWAKDRFPPKLRAHLAAANIRDVVHQRLLQKTPEAEPHLRGLFERHRPELKLYAYGCEDVTIEEFVQVYPMLPGQIELVLQITSALRTRSARAQGDDQAIRGLLQLLGELFRDQKLAEQPVGALVTLDRMYEVQHTALDSDTQASMARLLAQCTDSHDELLRRAAKAVALLELIQEQVPTDAKLVAQCLYHRVDLGNQVPAVTDALEELRRRNLLAYSEKLGYKVQSSAGEEWERERRDVSTPRDTISELVKHELAYLMATPERPKLQGRPFPLAGVFSDGRRVDNVSITDARDEASVRVDFRFLVLEDRTESAWVRRSDEAPLRDRLVWVAGDHEPVEQAARELWRSRAMVRKYRDRRASLTAARRILLQQEENRAEDLAKPLRDAVAESWMGGRMFFRARPLAPAEQGSTFAVALAAAATRVLPDLYPHFIATQVEPKELAQLLQRDLTGASTKFVAGGLGILDIEGGRYVPAASGIVPQRVLERIQSEAGLSGQALIAHFGGPPYGHAVSVVKACVAGLLRAGKVQIQTEAGLVITSFADPGVLDLFDKDRPFRRSTVLPAVEDDEVNVQTRARICDFFENVLAHPPMEREPHAIADAVLLYFPPYRQTLLTLQGKLARLPGSPRGPELFDRLAVALEESVRDCRQAVKAVKRVRKHLDVLRDGLTLLRAYDTDLQDGALRAVNVAHNVVSHQAAQMEVLGVEATHVHDAAERVRAQLAREQPWRGIDDVGADLESIRAAYMAERQRLLQWQERQTEEARLRVTTRQGFSGLTADQAHRVLRPLGQAAADTDAEAVAPALVELKDPFLLRLGRAEEEANSLLDAILSEGPRPLITRLDLGLRNREVQSEADVEALISEIRTRLLDVLRSGGRVRLQ